MPDQMQALVFTDFNQMTMQAVDTPQPEAPDDVIVKVRAAGVCGSDLHGYTGESGRRQPPLIMGHEAAGDVVAVGSAVSEVATGDRVAIQPLVYRPDPETGKITRKLIGMNLPGAYAEYVRVPEKNLFTMPDSVLYQHGALTEPLAVAVHAVSRVHVQPYDTALVIGAGTIGLLTLQVLKLAGAGQIVISDLSEERLAVAKQMGASATINPKAEDPTEAAHRLTNGQGFDLTFEAVGIGPAVAQSIAAVRDGGEVVWIGNNKRIVDVDMQAVVTRELRVTGTYGMNEQDFGRALAMISEKRVDVGGIINRETPLKDTESLFDELLADASIIKCVVSAD